VGLSIKAAKVSDAALDLGLRLYLRHQCWVVNLHPEKEPFRIALKNGCKLDADVAAWLAKSVDDSAQVGFINTQHFCQPVLPDSAGVDS
jgi:hypothetical protein